MQNVKMIKPSLETIRETVCERMGGSASSPTKRSPNRVLRVQRVFCAVARELGYTTIEIGEAIGRDYSTVIYSLKAVEKDRAAFDAEITAVRVRLDCASPEYVLKETVKEMTAEIEILKKENAKKASFTKVALVKKLDSIQAQLDEARRICERVASSQ